MTDRQDALEAAMSQLTKAFGEGSVMRLDSEPQPLEVIPTGSLSLDAALGVGGYPRGRIVEIFGPESSGKSTLALHAVANAQKAGGTVLYLDSEHSIDPLYSKALGVDISSLILAQPNTFEEGMEIALGLVKSGGLDLLVVDSVAAMIPRAELEGNVGDATVGLLARLMSQSMRMLTGPLSEHGTTAIFINQLRDTIGGFGNGPKETTTGGRALKFYSSQRLDVRRVATVRDSQDEAVANRTKVKVVKSKLAAPFKTCEFEIEYGTGISREGELIDLGVQVGVIKKAGAWLKYGDGNLAQGRANAVAALRGSPDLAAEIEQRVRDLI